MYNKKGTKLLLAYEEYILEFIIESSRSALRYTQAVTCSHGVMATRLASNQKILGSTPSVSVLFRYFSFCLCYLLNSGVLSKLVPAICINSLYWVC